MTPNRSPAVGRFLRFVALALIVTAVMIAVGYAPTKRMGGADAIAAMLAGCAISVVGSVIGAVPIITATRGPGRMIAQAVLLSTALRLMVVLALTLAIALSGWFLLRPLLLWVAISYVLLLAADTIHAVRVVGAAEDTESK